MAKRYKAPNKRQMMRGAGGRFREAVASDLGIYTCEKCGNFFTPDLSKFAGNSIVNPFQINRAKSFCDRCLSEKDGK